MTQYTIKPLLQKIKDLWAEKDTAYNRLDKARESICYLFRPDLGVDYDEANDMLMLGGDIYEGTPPWIARTAAVMFMGQMVSKRDPWFFYKPEDETMVGIDEIDEWVQDRREHIADIYQRGNFYDTQPQFTLDGLTTGSPLVFIEEDLEERRTMFLPTHYRMVRQYFNRFGDCEGVIIKDESWSAQKCFDKFCPPASASLDASRGGRGRDYEARLAEAEKKFSHALMQAIRQGNLTKTRFTIYRAVFVLTHPLWEGDFKRPLGRKLWYDVYFEDADSTPAPALVSQEAAGDEARRGGGKNNTPLLTEGYFSKPFVSWHYNKKPWESSSRTPAMEAMYDSLSEQQIFKYYLENLKLHNRPPMAVLSTMLGALDFSPEGLIEIANSSDWDRTPKPIEVVKDLKLDVETMDRFERNLTRHFHLELLRRFTDLAQAKNREFRVFELLQIQGEKINALIPMIETHESYLKQVDDRVVDIEIQAGRGPFEPMILERMRDIFAYHSRKKGRNRQELQIEFMGTLRQDQQMQQALKPISYGISLASEFAQAMGDPGLARMFLKGYETLDEALQAINFPQKLINEREVYDKLRAAWEQAQAQQKQFENQVELIKASKSLQGAIEPNSIMGMMGGAA